MPVHHWSFIKENECDSFIEKLFNEGMNEYDCMKASNDKNHLYIRRSLYDLTGNLLGHLVFYLFPDHRNNTLYVKDIDMVLLPSDAIKVEFEERLGPQEDFDEYYKVVSSETHRHFDVELVGRYLVDGEILGTEQTVSVSAFPFSLGIYDDPDDMNRSLGLAGLRVGKTDYTVSGLSDTFIGNGTFFSKGDQNDIYSFIVGSVRDIRYVMAVLGDYRFSYYQVILDTGIGTLSTAMSPDVFQLEKLRIGKIIAMKAYIKADLSME